MALSSKQYDALMRTYEETRITNHYLAQARRDEVYAAVPAIKEIDDSIGTLSRSTVRLLLEDDDTALANAKAQIAALGQKRIELLTSSGFPADYLAPIYKCKDCKDTGYIAEETGLRKKCHCLRRAEISILYSQSEIEGLLNNENFGTLSYEYYKGEDLQRFQSAVNLSKAFVNNFTKDYSNILFYGTVGTGKSFLSGCIAKELLDSAHSVLYFSSTTLFEKLAKYSFDYDSKLELQEFCDDLYNCDLLIIDDLGTELTNAFISSQLFACLNERHLRRRPIIISTNLSLEEIRDRYSDRIFSRISSSFSLCKLSGADIRIIKKIKSNASQNNQA